MTRPIDTNKSRACAPLLPDPGPEVVAEMCDEIDDLRAKVTAVESLENDIETHFTVFADYGKHPELMPERPSDPTKTRIMHIRVMRALSALREADTEIARLTSELKTIHKLTTDGWAMEIARKALEGAST